MDKELLKKYKLEEAQKRFQQICEYMYFNNTEHQLLTEEGEDEEQDPNVPQDGGQQPPMGDPNAPQGMEGDVPMEEPQNGMENGMGDPNVPQDGGQQPPMGDPNAPQGMEGGMDGDVPMEEDVPMDDMGAPMEDGGEMDMMQPGDEVVDVDDLTQSQQAAEIKIDDVDEKLTTLLNVVNKFSAAIEQNDKKIMDLKAEIEKRNPTEEEKLNLRSQAVYPYNVQPKSFWDEKMKNSNYNVSFDNEIPTSEEDKDKFTFTKKDLKGINDAEIAKSLEDYNQLSDFINF